MHSEEGKEVRILSIAESIKLKKALRTKKATAFHKKVAEIKSKINILKKQTPNKHT